MMKDYTLVNFYCPRCSREWTEIASVLYGDVVIQCETCNLVVTLQLAQNRSEQFGRIVEYPEVVVSVSKVRFGGEDDDKWLVSDPPDNPYAIFNDAYHRLGDLVSDCGDRRFGSVPHSAQAINGMIFATAIGAMEVFLGDLLIRSAMAEEVVLGRLLTEEHDLRHMSVRLQDAHRNPDTVKDKTRKYLGGLPYHNLSKVSELYRVAFKVKILPDAELCARLQRAVVTRHDIMHRNAKTKDGDVVMLKASDVLSVLNDIKAFVDQTYFSVTKSV